MESTSNNTEIKKRPVGRPPHTIEQKRESNRIYMQKYNEERYKTDEKYKLMKQTKAKNYYRNKVLGKINKF